MLTPPDSSLPPIERLRCIMAQLRSEEGCPWDREQSLKSLQPFLIEEAYEVIDAMDSGDTEHHCEELGDLLLQVVFQAQLAQEEGQFDFDDVARAISEKLERRHPHVYGDGEARTPDEVLKKWNEIKALEKPAAATSVLDRLPKGLPALLHAQETQRKAAKVGFDWPDPSGPVDKLQEELEELKQALASKDEHAICDEIGDVLFSVVNLCRHVDVHAELALQQSVGKFKKRFRRVEQMARAQEVDMKECDLAKLDRWWDEAKRQLQAGEPS